MCMNRPHYRSINFFLIQVLVVLACEVHAQVNKISGTITDADTGEPIPFANVFFANTSIGVSSDMEGKFVLQKFPNGKYDFTVAYVGYAPYQYAFDFNTSEYRLAVKLKTEEVRLKEIVIKADTNGWARNFVIFKKNFLGETENASQCTILNPRDIFLYFDKQARVLVAHANKPIIVENKALGFKIQWYLQKFELNYSNDRLEVFGIPSFQELTPKNERHSKQWSKARARAYLGSIPHFMRAMLADTWREEEFEVRVVNQVPNPERPSKEYLEKKIATLKADLNSSGDSLVYYSKLATKPETVEKTSKEIATTSNLIDQQTGTLFKGTLAVRYTNEKEETGYLATVGRTMRKEQDSFLRVLDAIKIYENGYYEPAYNVFVEQYWAWSEKVSDLLPLDYTPTSE
jgi:CarboxypepD_reg-like domain